MQIEWSEKVTNEELCTKVQPRRTLLQEVIQKKNCNCSDTYSE